MTVSVFGRLRLTLFLRKPCFDGLETAEIPRIATAVPVGAIEPDEHPAWVGRATSAGGLLKIDG